MTESSLYKKLTIFTLYVIYCFDIAAIVIVFIIFTPLLLDTTNHFLRADMSLAGRNIILGTLVACYPLAQFFASPILGDLSDYFGRRLILLISSFGTAFCFFLSALAILIHSLPILFISRLVGGAFAGNAALSQAAVSDYTPKSKKSMYMALFTIVGGFAWIIGPFLGSFFSNPKILPWFNYDVPFWLLGLIFLFSWGIILIAMPPDLPSKKVHNPSITKTFKSIMTIFHVKIIVLPLVCSGFYILGWMILQTFNAPFLLIKYQLPEQVVGYIYAYSSCWWLLGGVVAFFWFKRGRAAWVNGYALFLIPFFILAYGIIRYRDIAWWVLPAPNALMSIAFAAFMSLYTHLVSQNMQGKIFGAFTGLLALASALAPPLAGWLSRFSINLPFYVASGICFLTALVYFYWLFKNKRQIHQGGG